MTDFAEGLTMESNPVPPVLTDAFSFKSEAVLIAPEREGGRIEYKKGRKTFKSYPIPSFVYETLCLHLRRMAEVPPETKEDSEGRFELEIKEEQRLFFAHFFKLPTGDRIFIRIMRTYGEIKESIEEGISKDDLTRLNSILKEGRGLITVTGPAGSGRSATLEYLIRNRKKGPCLVLENRVGGEGESIDRVFFDPDVQHISKYIDTALAQGYETLAIENADLQRDSKSITKALKAGLQVFISVYGDDYVEILEASEDKIPKRYIKAVIVQNRISEEKEEGEISPNFSYQCIFPENNI